MRNLISEDFLYDFNINIFDEINLMFLVIGDLDVMEVF